jgi:transcriptional regulator
MYRPAYFREDRAKVLEAFVAAHPLGALVASTETGLIANHIPMLVAHDGAGRVLLHGHVARANDLWSQVPDGGAVLVLFGGAQHYITPSWYPSKQAAGEVVPTWNYAVVHAHGSIRFIQDRAWLRTLVETLTTRHEQLRTNPWYVDDAPVAYIEKMLGAIVGFEIAVERFEGKFKASQNKSADDRRGVAEGLAADGVPLDACQQLVRGE